MNHSQKFRNKIIAEPLRIGNIISCKIKAIEYLLNISTGMP